MNYTIDTNIITALMKDNETVKSKLGLITFQGKDVFINGISYYEVKRGLLAVNATAKLRIFSEICKEFGIMLLDSQVIFDEAAQIYADLKLRGELIEDADILIAAMAITQNLILVSDNTDHFQRIIGITLENWLT